MAKKRANGEGSIRKRSDGRWEGRYTAGRNPETGKPIYKNVLGKTQAEVKEKLAEAIEKSKGVDMARAGKYTLGQWMEVWFENVAQVKVRPSSHATYRGYLDNHIKPNIGNIPLHKLSTLDLQRFYREMLDGGRVERIESKKQPKGLSPKTVRNHPPGDLLCPEAGGAAEADPVQSRRGLFPAQTGTPGDADPVRPTNWRSFFREAKASGVFELYYLELATGLRTRGTAGSALGGYRPGTGRQSRVRRQVVRINGRGGESAAENKKFLPHPAPSGRTPMEILRQQRRKGGRNRVCSPRPPAAPSPRTVYCICSIGC